MAHFSSDLVFCFGSCLFPAADLNVRLLLQVYGNFSSDNAAEKFSVKLPRSFFIFTADTGDLMSQSVTEAACKRSCD